MNVAWAAPVSSANVAVNTSGLDAILQASLIVQLTLLILIGLSVVCWAIGFLKYKQFKQVEAANELFLNKFWKAESLDALYENVDTFKNSTIANVFISGYLEMQKLAGKKNRKQRHSPFWHRQS